MAYRAKTITSRGAVGSLIVLAVAAALLFVHGCGSDGYDQIRAITDGNNPPDGGNAVLGAPANPSIACDAAYGEDASGNTVSSWVQLTLGATDDVGVTGYYLSENPAGPDAAAASCAGGGPTVDTDCWNTVDPPQPAFSAAGIDYALMGEFGDYTIYVWFRDAEGKISQPASGSIRYVSAGGGCG